VPKTSCLLHTDIARVELAEGSTGKVSDSLQEHYETCSRSLLCRLWQDMVYEGLIRHMGLAHSVGLPT